MNETIAVASALGATFLWAIAVVSFGKPLRDYGPYACNTFKAGVACTWFWATVAVLGNFEQVLHLELRWVGALLLSGLIGMALGDWFFLAAMKEAGPRMATLLHATAPLFLLAYTLVTGRDRPSLGQGAGVLLIFVGVTVVIFRQRQSVRATGASMSKGLLWGFGSAFGQAAGILLAREALEHCHYTSGAAIRLTGAAIGLILGGALIGRGRALLANFVDRELWARAGWIVFIGTYLGIALMMVAVGRLNPAVSGAALSTTPLFVVPVATVILRERFDIRAALGIAAAVGGLVFLSLGGA